MTDQAKPPLLFTLGLHAHQPEGNFGHVFEEHLRDVYEPFLKRAVEGGLLPLTLHLSGPLLDWLGENNSAYLDMIGELAVSGQLELLLAGYYEPILPCLSREDRIEQVLWMKEALRERFGVVATGLWLTERVWEPDLAADLADAGVKYVLVDDRHFVASGFARDALHVPFRTEASGKSLGVFAIDEKLRYMIPFHPPEDTADYLRALRERGHRLAVVADDIEKFGGWPGTREWVYEKGWLDRFTRTMKGLEEAGEIRLSTFSQALEEVASGGLAYLPSASYREMEEWSLPAEGFRRIAELKRILGEDRFARGDSPLIRGSHWRNFLVKYPEANRMHKKMLALSGLCRTRGNPEAPRRALGRAQCNDAYWHGVFGGLYLRHLRDTIWRNLAVAEELLRNDESLGWEEMDLDLDGHPEIWIHSAEFSALISPHRGGAVEELTLFREGVNLANTLTRRREAYHEPASVNGDASEEGRAGSEPSGAGSHGGGGEARDGGGDGGAPSIHDLETGLRFAELPPVDREERAIFQERVLPHHVSREEYEAARYPAIRNWAVQEFTVEKIVGTASDEKEPVRLDANTSRDPKAEATGLRLAVHLIARGTGSLKKTLRFDSNGGVEVHLTWDASAFPPDAIFTTELSLGSEAAVTTSASADIWRFPIATFSKSERGFDETIQGESILVRWPAREGEAWVKLGSG